MLERSSAIQKKCSCGTPCRQLKPPVLVLRGAKPGALLSAEDADRYRQTLRSVRVVVLENSAHELWGPEYIKALQEFLGTVDDTSGLVR